MLFFFYRTLAAFIFPPGLFVTLCAVLGFMAGRKAPSPRYRRIAVALYATAGLLYLLSIEPVGDALGRMAEGGYGKPVPAQDLDRSDCYVVPGGGAHRGVPSGQAGKTGFPTYAFCVRLVEAARLYRIHPAPIIPSGGSLHAGQVSEAEIGRDFLVCLGIPEKDIIVEGESRTTAENARKTKALCGRMGYRTPALVTSSVHMRRALAAFVGEGMAVIPAPCDFMVEQEPYRWDSFLPGSLQLFQSRKALWELAGCVVYSVF